MSYRFQPDLSFSTLSRVHAGPAESYEIHFVKSDDPEYIPADMEVWPVYHSAILVALRNFPEAHEAALAAFTQKQQELKGRENRDAPRGTRPW